MFARLKKLCLLASAGVLCLCACLVSGCDDSQQVSGQHLSLTLNVYGGTTQTYEGLYTGTLVANLPDGTGFFESTNDDGVYWFYDGEWTNGHMNGDGTTVWSVEGGYKEEGSYSNDLFVSGTITCGDYVYEGALGDQGFYTGNATLTWISGENAGASYVGNFANGSFNGQGVYTYPDGRRYEGAFVDDEFCGQGTFYELDGSTWVGAWADDMLNGQATHYDKDGKVIVAGVYKNNVLVEELSAATTGSGSSSTSSGSSGSGSSSSGSGGSGSSGSGSSRS